MNDLKLKIIEFILKSEDQNKLEKIHNDFIIDEDDTITSIKLIANGWKYIEKNPFTGKSVWVKDIHINDCGHECDSFIYTPELNRIYYSDGYNGSSPVIRSVSLWKELINFYDVLKIK